MTTVGVIGGMGPAATVDFLAAVLRATPAGCDQDHLHLIVDQNPKVPDRNAGLTGAGPSPGPVLAEMAVRLERAGADFLVMICNTAHAFAGHIRAAAKIPLLDMIEETAHAVEKACPAGSAVGLLATDGCIRAGLYQAALSQSGIGVLTLPPAEQRAMMKTLYRIKSGERGEHIRAGMRSYAGRLVEAGARLILAGCTEIPLVLAAGDLDVAFVSSTDVLVRRTVAYARALEAADGQGAARQRRAGCH